MSDQLDTPRPKTRGWGSAVALGAVLVAVAGYLSAATGAMGGRFDDAYMFVRYADHFLDGHGHAWNPGGEQTYGSTSLLYFALVTLGKAMLPLADTTLLRCLSTGTGLAAVVMLAITCARFSRSGALRSRYLLWCGLVLPAILLSPVFTYHAKTGMGTMLGVLCNTVLIFFTLRLLSIGTRRAVIGVVVAAYFTYLARPDNGVCALLFPSLAIVLLGSASNRWRLLLTFLGGMAAVLFIDAGWKMAVFGVPFPLAAYAKAQGFYGDYRGAHMWNPMLYLLQFFGLVMPFLCTMIVFTSRRRLRVLVPFLIPLAITLAYYFTVTLIMGYSARFSLPFLPFVVVAAARLLDLHFVGREEHAASSSTRFLIRGMVVLALLASWPQIIATVPRLYQERFLPVPSQDEPDLPYAIQATRSLRSMDYWPAVDAVADLAVTAPEGALFSMSEYGWIGAVAPQLAILDPLGLHDADVARRGFSAQRFLDQKPDLIWFPHPDYRSIVIAILDADTFWNEYDFYPEVFRFGVALRRTGPHAEELRKSFGEAWNKRYKARDMQSYRARRRQ
ncbi:MAG: hypothetical protein QGI93_12440 [Planctomycetota bacterium]|nr:hypothetical protein [Planctomycetota bacterium]